MVSQVIAGLRSSRYQIDGDHQTLSAEVKKALVAYQRDAELHAGQLDYQTLDALGIHY